MPSKGTNEQGYKNLTLRLPNEYHRQVATQATRSGLTLNAHLINIIQRHLMDCGFAPDVIKSLSGRLFEVEVEPIAKHLHASGYFCSRFMVNEYNPLYTRQRAEYIFGIANALAGDIDPYGIVKDIGTALLNFYNRRGLEIDQLAWQTNPGNPPSPRSTIKDNWRYIGTDITKDSGEFMVSLARNHWRDDLLITKGSSQDIRSKSNYAQLQNELSHDEWMLLQGLAWIYAGVEKPISPMSSEFSVQYGIKDAKKARTNLLGLGLIDDHYEFQDCGFRSWIWQNAFGGIGRPPGVARMYPQRDRLDEHLPE